MPVQALRPSAKPREIELDFIRGIAILMVLDYHDPHPFLLWPFVWLGFPHFGWAGVDIFFVLSGFLVGGLLVKEWKVFGRIDSKQFLIRRGFKIWPQYYVFLLLILATGHHTLRFLWGNLLNIQNYTGGIAHTWTLAVEEHAYLLLVLLCAVAARKRIRMRTLSLILVGASAAVLTLRFALSLRGFDTFTRTDTRLDGILYGVMLAILYHYAPEGFSRLQRCRWVWMLVVGVTLAFFRFAPRGPVLTAPISCLLADASGVALLLLLYHHREGRVRAWPYRAVAMIGTYSYGIYLWHVSVIEPTQNFGARLPRWIAPEWLALAPCVFGMLLGVFFTKLVEFPALKLREKLIPRRVDSAVGTPAELEEPVEATPIAS